MRLVLVLVLVLPLIGDFFSQSLGVSIAIVKLLSTVINFSNIIVFTIRNYQNLFLPAKVTVYWKGVFNVRPLGVESPHFIIKFV